MPNIRKGNFKMYTADEMRKLSNQAEEKARQEKARQAQEYIDKTVMPHIYNRAEKGHIDASFTIYNGMPDLDTICSILTGCGYIIEEFKNYYCVNW